VISSKPSYLAADNDPNWLLCEGGDRPQCVGLRAEILAGEAGTM